MDDPAREQQHARQKYMLPFSRVVGPLEITTSGVMKRIEDWIEECRAEGCP